MKRGELLVHRQGATRIFHNGDEKHGGKREANHQDDQEHQHKHEECECCEPRRTRTGAGRFGKKD